jgi:hypothetical protein
LHADTSDIRAQEEGDCAQAPQHASSNNADKLLICFTTLTSQIDLGCLEVFAESANIAKTCVSTAPDGALFCLVRTGRGPRYLFSGILECGKSGSNFVLSAVRPLAYDVFSLVTATSWSNGGLPKVYARAFWDRFKNGKTSVVPGAFAPFKAEVEPPR